MSKCDVIMRFYVSGVVNVCLLYTLGHVPHYHNETLLVWSSFILIGGVITETGT